MVAADESGVSQQYWSGTCPNGHHVQSTPGDAKGQPSIFDDVDRILECPPVTDSGLKIEGVFRQELSSDVEAVTAACPHDRSGPISKRRSLWRIALATLAATAVTWFLVAQKQSSTPSTAAAADATRGQDRIAVASPPSREQLVEMLEANVSGVSGSLPLFDFIRRVGAATEVPVSLEVDNLKYVHLDYDSPIHVSENSASARHLLLSSLQPVNLVILENDFGFRVTSHCDDRLLPRPHDVSDLVANGKDGRALLCLIRDLVHPSSWKKYGGRGSMRIVDGDLIVTNQHHVHLDIMGFCDQLRHIRGVPVHGVHTIHHASQSRIANHILNGRCQFAMNRSGSLHQVLLLLERTAGCHILVDWPELARLGVTRSSTVQIRAESPTLEGALLQITDQWPMAFRVVGHQAIELTSHHCERSRNRLVVYPPNDRPIALNYLEAKINAYQLPPSVGRRVAMDPVSHAVIARLPWSAHRTFRAAMRPKKASTENGSVGD